MANVKLKDIAAELGLNVSVVSRALSPKPDRYAVVAEETKNRVLKTAERLGYRPNRTAEFMKRGGVATIGVFIPLIPNRLVADLMIGISQTASKHGFPLNFFFGNDWKEYQRFFRGTGGAEYSGMITYPFNHLTADRISGELKAFRDRGGRVLVLNSLQADKGIPVLRIDDAWGARQAAKILIGSGCTAFATDARYAIRNDTFTEAVGKKGFPTVRFDAALPQKGLLDLMTQKGRGPVGIFASSDALALSLYPILENMGLVIGTDVLLVGYDDLYLMDQITPSLTTIRQPFRELGEKAVDLLVQMIYGGTVENAMLRPWAVIRESTIGR
ncbi:MAG: LacI family DNA-binding transcriptional regulator [Planctomycetes bacterium]|nr:LacI family DNA-binding transcriptional regulator [Planctomycetota bacterium]